VSKIIVTRLRGLVFYLQSNAEEPRVVRTGYLELAALGSKNLRSS
jgi:hypothetical protein